MAFKLPFPTLQDLAVLKIAHSFLDLEVTDDEEMNWANSLRESLKKVDKLILSEKQKCRIREAVKGTRDHIQKCHNSPNLFLHTDDDGRMILHFDVHGCVDEVRLTREHLQKCHSNEPCNTQLSALQVILNRACYNALFLDIEVILPKILKLLAIHSNIPQVNLKGPKFQIDRKDKLCLVYQLRQGIRMSVNIDYFDDYAAVSALRVSNTSVRVTLNHILYNSELFQLHWNLLEESKRISFFRNMISTMSSPFGICRAVNILHFLDPDSRRSILSELHEEFDTYEFLRCLLVWPYQVFFLSALELVRSQRELLDDQLTNLFKIIVRKQEMMAFKEILSPFWEAISSEVISRRYYFFCNERFKNVLGQLSQKNVLLYERIVRDMNFPRFLLQGSRKRKYTSSSSDSGSESP